MKHQISFVWETESIYKDADVAITVTSHKLKGLDESPHGVLFKTHRYEFLIVPKPEFYKQFFRESGFIVELKLFKKTEKDDVFKFDEFTVLGKPVITYSFREDVPNKQFHVDLAWPDEKYSLKGDFTFRIAIYRKTDQETFKKVLTAISSCFQILSKPGVYFAQTKKKISEFAWSVPKPHHLTSLTQEEPPHRLDLELPPTKKVKLEFQVEENKSENRNFMSWSFSQEMVDVCLVGEVTSPPTDLKFTQDSQSCILPSTLELQELLFDKEPETARLLEPETAKLLEGSSLDPFFEANLKDQ